MKRYKQYAKKGGRMPYSTASLHRKRAEERRKLRMAETAQQINQQVDAELQINRTHISVVHDGPFESGIEKLRSWDGTTLENFIQDDMVCSDSGSSNSSDSTPGRGIIVHAHRKKKKKKAENPLAKVLPVVPLSSDSEDNAAAGIETSFACFPSAPMSTCRENLESSCPLPNESDHVEPIHQYEDSSDSKWNSETLCPCTAATVGDVYFMVLNLGLKHGLTWTAQVDILTIIESLFQKKIPTSKHLYLKEHANVEENITHHIFCNICGKYQGPKENVHYVMDCSNEGCTAQVTVLPTHEEIVCQQCNMKLGVKKKLALKFTKCINDDCKNNISVNSPESFFLTLSMQSQFKTFLKDEQFVKKIMTYRFKRQSAPDFVSDIYDGKVYKSLFENGGVLSSPYNFSYSFFIDGMKYGNTSNKTLWPIYVTINELPYEDRAKYLVLAGLYVGPKDPDIQVFLQPFASESNTLSRQGFTWEYNGTNVTSYTFPLCCIADSAARYKILNFQAFNSYYGCTFCYQKSQRTRVGQRFTLLERAPLRSNDSMRQDLQEVYKRIDKSQSKDRVYRGVIGFTVLLTLDNFCIGSNMAVDYLHNICIGVTKHHLELILESVRKKIWITSDPDIGVEHIVKTLDERLTMMQSCSSVIRELRPVKDKGHWRGSEFRLWLLFYGVPCMTGLLRNKYLVHFALLGKAISLLLKKSIHFGEIRAAHEMLMLFTLQFKNYFGEENMRYNIHLLSHIALGVQNFGPLWTHNSFLYESQNRYTRQLAKNPNSVIQEIAKKFLIYRSLPLMCSKMVKSEKTIEVCEKIFERKLQKFFRVDSGCVLLGGAVPYFLSHDERLILYQYANADYESSLSYKRMILRRRKYCTVEYCKNMRNNDSCVLLRSGQFVLIRSIWLLPQNEVVLYGELLNISRRIFALREFSISIDNIRRYEKSSNFLCFPHHQVAQPCLVLNTVSGDYVSPVPFGCSVE